MEISQGPDQLDPKTISDTARAGKVAIIRQREQLLAAGKIRGLSFTEQGGGNNLRSRRN